jgi:sodium-dependent dicarboxylate transporter 2/3/5
MEGLSEAGWLAVGLAVWMALWWITECVPLAVTALLPLIVAPFLGAGSLKDISGAYADPIIFLFFGGFLISLGIERSRLHLRIAHWALVAVGSSPRRQVGAVMGITAFLSMWMSNTATSVMMLPLAVSIIALRRENGASSELSAPMLLGIAYGASIGGLATIVGTPPNAFLAAYLQNTYDVTISFDRWMLFGVPLSLVLLTFTWWWLTRALPSREEEGEAGSHLREGLRKLGPIRPEERRVAGVFLFAALSWIFRGFLVTQTGLPLSDTGIALAAGLLLFVIPRGNGDGDRLLDWPTAHKLPWGVLLLFGGGLCLARIIRETELDAFLGSLFANLQGIPFWLVALIVVAVVVGLTEITSNTATTATLLPVLGPVALALGFAPGDILIPTAVAASCAFMMPVATPPNAIVFGSGELAMRDMVRAGFVLNLVSIVVLTIAAEWIVPWMF